MSSYRLTLSFHPVLFRAISSKSRKEDGAILCLERAQREREDLSNSVDKGKIDLQSACRSISRHFNSHDPLSRPMTSLVPASTKCSLLHPLTYPYISQSKCGNIESTCDLSCQPGNVHKTNASFGIS